MKREDDDTPFEEVVAPVSKVKTIRRVYKLFRMCVFGLLWLVSFLAIIFGRNAITKNRFISVAPNTPYTQNLDNFLPHHGVYLLVFEGPLVDSASPQRSNRQGNLKIEFICEDENGIQSIISKKIDVNRNIFINSLEKVEKHFEVPAGTKKVTLQLSTEQITGNLPLSFALKSDVVPARKSVAVGAILLFLLYLLIVLEIVDRVFAALLIATGGIGVLCMLHLRPSMRTIISWIDIKTLILLFSMMILVAVLAETGFFDIVAVYAFRISRGHPWPMIYVICLFTAFLSAFLDNVTMMLLMTPVTIRLCEVMELRVIVVLIVIVSFSNLGGGLTPVSDPPNVIIASNAYVQASGVNFMEFCKHMVPIIIIGFVATVMFARYYLREKGIRNPPETEEAKLEREMEAWNQAKNSLGYSKKEQETKEEIAQNIENLKNKYAAMKRQPFGLQPTPTFAKTLVDMQSKYKIRNKSLLIKSCIVILLTIIFFLADTSERFQLQLHWCALLPALLILILADAKEIAPFLERVEWGTLLFFAALFVIMETLTVLGLIQWIGQQVIALISASPRRFRLPISIILLVWVSGFTSAFIDNIPITQMMIKVIIQMNLNTALDLPLEPLIWSLVVGTCFGSNGTLIGSSSNLVMAGIASQHGYKVTFMAFFRIGFPITILNLFLGMVYLLICHCAFTWHTT